MSLKNRVTRPGIDPGTVRLVAQRLNHYATPGPVRHVAVLNTVGSCNTVVLYYNFVGLPSYMRSVVDRNIIMRRIAVFTSYLNRNIPLFWQDLVATARSSSDGHQLVISIVQATAVLCCDNNRGSECNWNMKFRFLELNAVIRRMFPRPSRL
jgi:hypothetical protein